jgi:hypothetical protein
MCCVGECVDEQALSYYAVHQTLCRGQLSPAAALGSTLVGPCVLAPLPAPVLAALHGLWQPCKHVRCGATAPQIANNRAAAASLHRCCTLGMDNALQQACFCVPQQQLLSVCLADLWLCPVLLGATYLLGHQGVDVGEESPQPICVAAASLSRGHLIQCRGRAPLLQEQTVLLRGCFSVAFVCIPALWRHVWS